MIVSKAKEKPSSINIEELHRTREKKIREKVGAFKEVLRLCHLKIKKTARDTSECYCFYVIPPIVIGYPLYDINSCTLYVVEKLVENGFNVVYTHPNLLLISWYQKPRPAPPIEAPIETPLPHTKQFFKSTSEYHPSQNFVSTNPHQEYLKKKANSLLNDYS